MKQILQIAIDARAASHPQYGGFKTYTEGLVEGLVSVDYENKYTLLVDRPYIPRFELGSNFDLKVVKSSFNMVGAGWREQISVPLESRSFGLSILHFPCNTGAIWGTKLAVVTIHDLIPVLQKPKPPSTPHLDKWRRFFLSAYSTLVMQVSPRRFAAVITDSHASRNEIMAYYRIDPRKLFVIPLGYAPIFRVIGRQQAKGIAEKTFGIEGRFILALGSADPRKNLQGVIRAYQMLNDDLKSQYRLTLVLNHADVEERVNKEITRYELKDRVSLVMRPSQEELVALYNAADVFLFPSFVEGFGLPALEAMACGTPTIVSNRSSLPEVTGDAGLLVSPDDPQEIAAQLERVLTNQSLKIELSERGLRRAGHFSWQRTARMTLDVYRYAAEQDRVA